MTMAEGRMFKRCGCRDPKTRRLLGRSCPRLRRPGGGWSPHHGSWGYQLELPPTRDGKRRNPLRRSGFPTQMAAEAELTRAQELLAISTDRAVQIKITDLIADTVKRTRALPDPDTVRRKVRTGQDINRQISFGDWLEIWLKGKKRIRESTRQRYASDIKLYLKPHLGHIEVQKLRVADFNDMFDQIEEYNGIIKEARASDDPKVRAKVKWRRPVNPPTRRPPQTAGVDRRTRPRLGDRPPQTTHRSTTARGRETHQPDRGLLRRTQALTGNGVDPATHPHLPRLRPRPRALSAVPAHRPARA